MRGTGRIIQPSTLLVTAVVLAFIGWSALAREDAGSCQDRDDVAIWVSPRAPVPGEPLRAMAVILEPMLTELAAYDPDGNLIPLEVVTRGGPPWRLSTSVHNPQAGVYRFEILGNGSVATCRHVTIAEGGTRTTRAQARLAWDQTTEAFYSAWIEQLFDAPPEEDLSLPSLGPLLRHPNRNFLHNYLGLGEDNALEATPDCADLPYLLRAYFAWKLKLPFGFRTCSRGADAAPPRCTGLTTNEALLKAPTPLLGFKRFVRLLMDGVHSGNGRTALNDDETDFYPVELRRDALRPGTLYADPYGHTLIIVKWIPQTTERGGLLLAVDAQPDNSVSRKRFWEGTFLFRDDVKSAGPGFKAFRPLVRTDALAPLRPLPNAALAADPRFVPYSAEQAELTPDDFYARMGKLINPNALDPIRAYEAVLDALLEQLETRVKAVNNGERYINTHRGTVIPMPGGAAIFETTGPWEDYSTPSRDLRLIIAMNVLQDLPRRVVRHPELFLLDGRSPEAVKAEVDAHHRHRIEARGITYARSDGSLEHLRVADILARRTAFEMAYNPNDCIEIRWGATPGTEEYATCRRHAPAAQRAKMEQYRVWFREVRRPSR